MNKIKILIDSVYFYFGLVIIGILIGVSFFSLKVNLPQDDFGSVADWFGAIGTIGSVMVSLWLASDNRKKFHWNYDCSLLIYKNRNSGEVTNWSFQLNGYNDSERYEAIKHIDLIYNENKNSLGANIEIKSHEIINYDFNFNRQYKGLPLQSKMFDELLNNNDSVTVELILYSGNAIKETIKPTILVQ